MDHPSIGGGAPVTLLCCDNLPDNGDVLRKLVLQGVENLGDKDLSEWIAAKVTFPNSMVDRITPAADETTKL